MKIKLIAILLAILMLLTGCRWRQPIQTPQVNPTGVSATQNPSLGGVSSNVPKLPDRFSGMSPSQIKLKVFDIKVKKMSEMSLNDYLCGVLAGEIQQDWPMEALKAQAIIARTFLMQFLNENKTSKIHPEADVSTDPEESQAFDASGLSSDNIRKAVNDTDGIVLAYNGQFIHAWFHSESGGKTADAVEGLNYKEGNPPYIQSVTSDESMAPKEEAEWQNTFTTSQITAALKKINVDVGGKITDVKIGKTGPSGRAETLLINGKDVPAPDFRVAIDPMKFRSTLLTDLKFDGSKLTVKGKGYGHGVGMPQWGAYQMAKNGKTAQDIINYYFKGVNIVNLWNK